MKLRKIPALRTKEIGHSRPVFHLPEEVFEICHQHKNDKESDRLLIAFMEVTALSRSTSPFIQPEYIVRQTVFVRC